MPDTSPTYNGKTIPIRPSLRRGGTLLIDLPIGARLTLGFLAAALIAALVTGATGLQRSQSLSSQAEFYRSILTANTNLNTGSQYLQLMKTETQSILALLQTPQPSNETLQNEKDALKSLVTRYDGLLNNYVNNDVLAKHPEQQSILDVIDSSNQLTHQQIVLVGSAQRTWNIHKTALNDISRYFDQGDIARARYLEQVQVELTNSDATSALRALIQFNVRLTDSINSAETVEFQDQVIFTIIGSIIAFILILIIGLVISGTLVRRLRQLRNVTQAVEQGQFNRRVNVVGRDEIADVSGSVNAMLEAIVGLLDETRNQRDALTNAAEHLFTDMRVVSAGDLRINAPVSNDPIGMLANAFNFTVGRFRRFVQRTRTTAEQLDVIARQQTERSESFTQALLQVKTTNNKAPLIVDAGKTDPRGKSNASENLESQQVELLTQLRQTRELMRQVSDEEILQRIQTILKIAEQSSHAVERLTNFPKSVSTSYAKVDELRQQFSDDLQLLASLNKRITQEMQISQHNTTRGFQELDKEMSQITARARLLKTQAGQAAPTAANVEAIQEVVKYSTQFANDVHALARQVSQMAQEIRTGIVSFQLDTVESGSTMAPLPQPGFSNPSLGPTPQGQASPSMPGRKNSMGLLETR
ncbi:HAMP domain-containing protein [Dictyobacter aurantiacus]|uniref:HAMP domain-containing protein n=1 Tax=Dictyobacter aurantiacus TaxID=1936993 RepID=A0A401ZBU2_9CHLR|nr:HAMP domain-containing protein [Dictyobacter aurantiacus]GCE04371.1 hypothetical protein KDAU_17000 [Dictyobacter aurantiacus]